MHTTVLLVEDHQVVREVLADRINAEPDLEVVGSAGSIAEASTVMDSLATEAGGQPAVAVIDLRLPDGNGVALCRQLRSRHPGLHCVFLTSHDPDDALLSAIIAGADGYVLKQMVGFELSTAIREAGAGEDLIGPEQREAALEVIQRQRARTEPGAALTPPEPAVLDLILAGRTDAEIATRLDLPEKAVRGAATALLEKLSWRSPRPMGRAAEPTARGPGPSK